MGGLCKGGGMGGGLCKGGGREGGLCKGGGRGGGGLYKFTPFWLTGMLVGNDRTLTL